MEKFETLNFCCDLKSRYQIGFVSDGFELKFTQTFLWVSRGRCEKSLNQTFPGSSEGPTGRLECRSTLQSHREASSRARRHSRGISWEKLKSGSKRKSTNKEGSFHRFHLPHAYTDKSSRSKGNSYTIVQVARLKKGNLLLLFRQTLKGTISHKHTHTRDEG